MTKPWRRRSMLTVHAEKSYEAQDMVFDGRFVDILKLTPDGDRIVDMTRFHDIEEMAVPAKTVSP